MVAIGLDHAGKSGKTMRNENMGRVEIYYPPRTSLNVGILGSDMMCVVVETRTMIVESKDKLNEIKQNADPR